MKWLIVTSQFPWPIAHGQWLRVYHLARALRGLGDDVSVLTCGENAASREGIAAYETLGVSVAHGPDDSHRSRGRSRTFLGPYAFDPRMADAVARHSRTRDAVLLSHSRMLQYAREAARGGGCVIADIGDDPVLEYGRRRNNVAASRNALSRWKMRLGRGHYERRGVRDIRAATFVSDADAESFGSRHPRSRTCCVSNGVDTDYFRRPDGFAPVDNPPTLVFTGHMGNPNNRWAAEFLVRSVAPIVWSNRDDVRVQIVGAEPSPEVLDLANRQVEVTGTVPDIRPYLWNANLVTLTMQTGTGIKNKLLEAWAAGSPVVATPLACQGVDARDGVNLAVADTAEQLAARILELLTDDDARSRLADEGRRTVQRGFTWEAAATSLRELALAPTSAS